MRAVVLVQQLNHKDRVVAAQIHAVLVLAYAQEALLLQVKHFAPLERTVEDIQASTECFLGAFGGENLLGVLSFGPDDEPDQINIGLLVVHPKHQRQGIGRSLLAAALDRVSGTVFSVSTAAKNAPALALYGEFGFAVYRHGTIGPEALELVKLRLGAP